MINDKKLIKSTFISDGKVILMLVSAVFLLFSLNLLRNISLPKINTDMLNNFYLIFTSIVLEGFPFIIIGSLISSFIQLFISEEKIIRYIPKNKIKGLIFSSLLGLVFPLCDCATIPVAKNLIKKGIPKGMAITFMLSVPIVNPIVIISTFYAFRGKTYIVISRLVFGIIAAIVIGYLVDLFSKENILKSSNKLDNGHVCHEHCHNSCEPKNLSNIIYHTSSEVYDIGRLFIIGALTSAFFQTYIPEKYILSIGQGKVYSILIMLVLAYILSICSQTDAFIGRSFLGQFTAGSVIGFLILGPMIDIKNTLMMVGTFTRRFSILLIFFIFTICFALSFLAEYIIPFSLKLVGGI